MENKALKFGVVVLGILAISMVVYYKYFRAHVEEEVSFSPVSDSGMPAKSEYEGIYSPTESVEADGKRISFLSISKRADGTFIGFWRADKISESDSTNFDCSETKIQEKEFFLRCANPEYGSLSYDGKIQNMEGGFSIAGKLLWTNQAAIVLEKNVELSHTMGN